MNVKISWFNALKRRGMNIKHDTYNGKHLYFTIKIKFK